MIILHHLDKMDLNVTAMKRFSTHTSAPKLDTV